MAIPLDNHHCGYQQETKHLQCLGEVGMANELTKTKCADGSTQ